MYCDIYWQHPRKALTCETSEREVIFLMGQRFVSFARLCSFTRDSVVVEGHFLHAKLRLAGFDLNTSSFAAANSSFKQFIKLLDAICSCADLITVDGEFVPQRFQIAFRIP